MRAEYRKEIAEWRSGYRTALYVIVKGHFLPIVRALQYLHVTLKHDGNMKQKIIKVSIC